MMSASQLEILVEERSRPGVAMEFLSTHALTLVKKEITLVGARHKAMAMYTPSYVDVEARKGTYRVVIQMAEKQNLLITHKCAGPDVWVFVTQPDQVWRAQAYCALLKVTEDSGDWNEVCERLSSYLLGYSDAEVHEWITDHRWRKASWKGATLYMVMSSSQRRQVEEHGNACVPPSAFAQEFVAFAPRTSRTVVRADATELLEPGQVIARASVESGCLSAWINKSSAQPGDLIVILEVTAEVRAELNRALVSKIEFLDRDGWLGPRSEGRAKKGPNAC